MKKRILALLLCLVFVVLSAGCKTKDDENEQNKVTSEQIESKKQLEEALNESLEELKKEVEQSGIEIDVKPLEDVDRDVLLESASALGFENEKFFEAFANAIDKQPEDVTQEDVDKVHYVAVGPESDDDYTVYIGYVDYVDLCFSDTDPDLLMSKLNEVVMISEFDYNAGTDTLSDLGNFKNVEMFEIYNVVIDDVSFIKQYSNLVFGYFDNNGITDVSSLADYNPESLRELDFTNNDISDWTPLHHIKDKVIVFYGEVDGMPITITLKNMLEQDEKEALEELEESEESEESLEKAELVDANGEQVDFGSLFD